MSQLVFLRHLARQTPRVALSRLRRGPARSSWSFPFELFARAMRETSLELAAMTWAEQRAAYDALAMPYQPVLQRFRREATTLGGVRTFHFAQRGARVDPKGRGPAALLYLHGGGYVFGSARSHGELVARLATACDARAWIPEYRLAPEHPFPAAIDDAVACYRALVASGVDPKRLVVAGDSAGGGLTTALLLRLRDAGDRLPAGAVLLCPWVDLTAAGGSIVENAAFDWGNEEVGHRWIEAYLGGHHRRDPLASPVFADMTGLPPLLVQVGGAELLYDQVSTFAARAKAHGVDVRLAVEPDMVHAWQSFAGVFSDCGGAIDQIGRFAREVVA